MMLASAWRNAVLLVFFVVAWGGLSHEFDLRTLLTMPTEELKRNGSESLSQIAPPESSIQSVEKKESLLTDAEIKDDKEPMAEDTTDNDKTNTENSIAADAAAKHDIPEALTPKKEDINASLTVSWEKRKDGKLEFIHIPKTGGTSVEFAGASVGVQWGSCHYKYMNRVYGTQFELQPLYPGCFKVKGKEKICGYHECWHQPPTVIQFGNQKEHWPSPYTDANLFAVVRNPYTKMISEYYCQFMGYKGKDKTIDTLNAFLMNRLSGLARGGHRDKSKRNVHMIPQAEFIFDYEDPSSSSNEPQQVVDHLLFQEDMSHEFDVLMQHYNLTVKLPHVNEGKIKRGSKRMGLGALNSTTIALINSVYADDFRRLGYQKVDPKNVEEGWDQSYNVKSIYMPSS